MRTVGPSWGLLFLAFLLTACGGSDIEPTSPATLIALVPPVPASQQTQPRGAPVPAAVAGKDTVAGVDSNANGVRDDVERRVDDFDLKPEAKKAVLQLARATQVALTTSFSEEAARKNGAQVLRAQSCMAALLPDFTTYLAAVRAETLNTAQRGLAWQAFEEKIARLQFPELQGAHCD